MPTWARAITEFNPMAVVLGTLAIWSYKKNS